MGKRNNWQDFQLILEQHQIKKLYHFTDRENLQNIINNGGLYSWADCEEKGITIAKPGGGNPSRKLDKKHGLEHYVRLSFTKRHPMMFVAKDDGRINNPVILEINPEILFEENTLFSDKNAASNDAHVGGTLDDFKKIHFKSVKASKHFDLEESEQPYFQAEILVKNFVPLSYITNIESFGIPIKQTTHNEESLTTEVTKEDLDNGVKDEFGAIYSSDGKRLLKGPKKASRYVIEQGTRIIADNAFMFNTELIDVVIPDSIIKIGDSSFLDCSSILSISLPPNVLVIGDRAFENCESIQSVFLPQAVDSIGNSAFCGCGSLRFIFLPSNVTTICDRAFYNCWSLQYIIMPRDLTHIGNQAFCGCDSLQSISLPQGVNHIGRDAFVRCDNLGYDSICKSLKYVFIPSGTKEKFERLIDDDRITALLIEDTIESIKNKHVTQVSQYDIENGITDEYGAIYSFDGRRLLRGPSCASNYRIRKGTKIIADKAFESAWGLASITIPETVTHIGNNAFGWCDFKAIILPPELEHVGDNPFIGCNELMDVICLSPHFIVYEYGFYTRDWKNLISYFGKGSPSLPPGVTHICDEAFSFSRINDGINDLPKNITHIGNRAFEGCTISGITLPQCVTHIGESAFRGCKYLSSLSLYRGIIHVGEKAFWGCKSISTIFIPEEESERWFSFFGFGNDYERPICYLNISTKYDYPKEESWATVATQELLDNGVTDEYGAVYSSDGKCLLKGPTSETSYSIKPGTLIIADQSFHACYELREITVPDTVTLIGYAAFCLCRSLQNISFPNSIMYIGDNAFYGCDSLRYIFLPKFINYFGSNAFVMCNSPLIIIPPETGDYTREKYKRVLGYIPKDNTTLGISKEYSIEQFIKDESTLTTRVTQVDLDNGVKDEYGAIYSLDRKRLLKGPGNVLSYTIQDGTLIIADRAFEWSLESSTLTHIIIPDSVVKIGDYAFCRRNLNSIILPNNIRHIGLNPFEGCKQLQLVKCNSLFKVDGSALYTKDGQRLISYFGAEDHFSIPISVTHICDKAFAWRNSLRSISLSENLTHIGIDAFIGCECLRMVSFYHHDLFDCANLSYIGDGAFAECQSLSDISLPPRVTHIGNRAFSGCRSLNAINLPQNVTYIGHKAFSYCRIKTITLPMRLKCLDGNPFSGCSELQNVSCLSPWFRVIENAIYTINGKTLISYFGKKLFISIPQGVTHIGKGAFSGNKYLGSILWSSDMSHIGDRAFAGCFNLQIVSLPKGLVHIGEGAFAACGSLRFISFSEKLTYIGNNAFAGCELLGSVTLPQSIAYIGDLAFDRCKSLKTVTFPHNLIVTNTSPIIGRNVFNWCWSLQNIFIPSNTKEWFSNLLNDAELSNKLIEEKSVSSDDGNAPF